MGREIRRVPKNWEHPKRISKYNGEEQFRPMMDWDFEESYADFEKDLKEWYIEQKEFENGKVFEGRDKIYSKANGNTYEDWAGEPPSPPNPYDYMPEGAWFQLFENVSEGTPLSPPFETKEELVEWLVSNPDFIGHQWTRPQAEGMLRCGYAPSMIIDNGRIYTSEQAAELQNNKEE